jgi:hypothetical protein
MGLTVNILTSGFLVTVIIFFVLTGILFFSAYSKVGQVLEAGDSKNNDLTKLDSVLNSIKVAYILAFIAAALTFVLAILYAGHETVITPSEYWHLAIYLITYVLLVISVIYAYIALNKLYDIGITQRNGADAYIWAGLLMSIFAFVGLTATGTGRLGMNIVRTDTRKRIEKVEGSINTHLPAIRNQVETHLSAIHDKVDTHLPAIQDKVDNLPAIQNQIDTHLPTVRAKVDQLHESAFPSKYQSFGQNFGQFSQSSNC